MRVHLNALGIISEDIVIVKIKKMADIIEGESPPPILELASRAPSAPSARKAAAPLPEWKSCCFRMQPQAATFAVQVFFSAFLVFFSAYKLIIIEAPDPLYVSLLTTTVGVWLPSPLHASASLALAAS